MTAQAYDTDSRDAGAWTAETAKSAELEQHLADQRRIHEFREAAGVPADWEAPRYVDFEDLELARALRVIDALSDRAHALGAVGFRRESAACSDLAQILTHQIESAFEGAN